MCNAATVKVAPVPSIQTLCAVNFTHAGSITKVAPTKTGTETGNSAAIH